MPSLDGVLPHRALSFMEWQTQTTGSVRPNPRRHFHKFPGGWDKRNNPCDDPQLIFPHTKLKLLVFDWIYEGVFGICRGSELTNHLQQALTSSFKTKLQSQSPLTNVCKCFPFFCRRLLEVPRPGPQPASTRRQLLLCAPRPDTC